MLRQRPRRLGFRGTISSSTRLDHVTLFASLEPTRKFSMKRLSFLLSFTTILTIGVPLAQATQADDTTITITAQNPGATPFISQLTLMASDTSVIKSVQFTITPKPGSVTRPLSGTFFERIPHRSRLLKLRYGRNLSLRLRALRQLHEHRDSGLLFSRWLFQGGDHDDLNRSL